MISPEESATLSISLPHFDGPFDLLISLIRRNEWSIDDLPVREITAQFLAYVKKASELDEELGGEFVETASWLVLLKSRSILPADSLGGLAPREELRRAVLDHATLAAKKEFLLSRYDGNLHPASAGASLGRQNTEVFSPEVENFTVQDVLEAAQRALEAARAASSLGNVGAEGVTVQDRIHWIGERLAALAPGTAVSTSAWFAAQSSLEARACLLLALLELACKGYVILYQPCPFGALRVKSLRKIPRNLQSDAEAFMQAV